MARLLLGQGKAHTIAAPRRRGLSRHRIGLGFSFQIEAICQQLFKHHMHS